MMCVQCAAALAAVVPLGAAIFNVTARWPRL